MSLSLDCNCNPMFAPILDLPLRCAALPAAAPAQPPPVDAIDQATRSIRQTLKQSGAFDDVTHADLRRIDGTLESLSAADRNVVFARLTDAELKTWADESGSHGLFGTGGLTGGEKGHLMDTLAGALDGRQLARAAGAFRSADDARLLGDAIQHQSNGPDQLAFVSAMRSRVAHDERAAVEVAKAVAGLGDEAPLQGPALPFGTRVERALDVLGSDALHSVVAASTQEHMDTPGSWFGSRSTAVVVSYDADPLADLLGAVGTARNPVPKAEVFQMASASLKEIAEAGGINVLVLDRAAATDDVARGLSGLLSSDTNGVMRALEHGDRDGKALSAFTKSLVEKDRSAELKGLMLQLQRGNDGRGDPIAQFTATEGADDHRNAQTLGYFVGAVESGISAISVNRDRQALLLKTVLAGSLSGGKDVAGVWLGAGSKGVVGLAVAATAMATIGLVNEITSELKAGDKTLRAALSDFAFPRLPNGDKYEGERAETAYDTAAGRVMDARG